MRVDLVWLSEGDPPPPAWESGQVLMAAPKPDAVAAALRDVGSQSEFVLFWDALLGLPAIDRLASAVDIGGDVWHAGLRLGMSGLPTVLDFVNPGWRFARDPEADRVATSWRLSLRACLVRSRVLSDLGGPNPTFETLTAAALELGHRWISNGALMRHVPQLVDGAALLDAPAPIPLADEFRFVRSRFGTRWARWALWRVWANGISAREALAAYQTSSDLAPAKCPQPLHSTMLPAHDPHGAPSVSVLIPTLDRYPHLLTVLDQLRDQTVAPLDIVVVDQTAAETRDRRWPEQFDDLPLCVIWQDEPGQCSSRNAGLQAAQGDMILFLDDDDEIEPDLIERHLAFLQLYGVDASCGVAEEVGAGSLPAAFTYVRDSDVFPTNNTMLRKAALHDSGLFDLAYERGARADADLGMRLYLAGKSLVLNPMASVLHLHASRGGLRQHKARVVTSASSQSTLLQRNFLSSTEAYLLCRYFTKRQRHEAVLIRTFASLRTQTGGWRRLARLAMMTALLPDTYRRNRRNLEDGRRMMERHPTIPALRGEALQEIL